MNGFVYIWFDRKKKKFYIGSHWGTESDGYICSSSWMKQAYKNRPIDFRRRILAYRDTKRELLDEENRWQAMIKPEEIGKRYYNLSVGKNHWSTHITPDLQKRLTQAGVKRRGSHFHNTDFKLAQKQRMIDRWQNPEWQEKMKDPIIHQKQANKIRGRVGPNKGKVLSEEWKRKIALSHMGMNNRTRKAINNS
jgi:hypothetical protein